MFAKTLFVVAAVACLVSAEKGSCGNGVEYDYTNGVLTISGNGEMKDYGDPTNLPWWSHYNEITSVIVGPGVKKLGVNAFTQLSNLVDVKLSNGLEYIAGSVFSKCRKLEQITVPATVSFIGDRAFYDCDNLKQLVYPGIDPPSGGSIFDNELSVCVPRDYKKNSANHYRFRDADVDYCISDNEELQPIVSQHSKCFMAMICNETYGFVMEREDMAEYKKKASTACGSYYCKNETGAAWLSSCDSPKICYMKHENGNYNDTCEEKDSLPDNGWRVILKFKEVNTDALNRDELIANILNISGKSDLDFVSEVGDDGSFVSLSAYVESESDAKDIKSKLSAVISSSKCSYGVLCKCDVDAKKNSAEEGSASGGGASGNGSEEVNASHHNHESLFLLFLAVMASILFFY